MSDGNIIPAKKQNEYRIKPYWPENEKHYSESLYSLSEGNCYIHHGCSSTEKLHINIDFWKLQDNTAHASAGTMEMVSTGGKALKHIWRFRK